ncbi:MAG: hypothetical protein U0941_08645 [Planctomycetaceae bacterium]
MTASRKWSWKHFRFVDTSPWVEELYNDLLTIFQADIDVEVVQITDRFPW